MIIIKVTQKHGLALSLENTYLEKPPGGNLSLKEYNLYTKCRPYLFTTQKLLVGIVSQVVFIGIFQIVFWYRVIIFLKIQRLYFGCLAHFFQDPLTSCKVSVKSYKI